MNTCILNSGSFTYNDKTYNYIETDNHYNFPYVFKTGSSLDPTIYVKTLSTQGSGSGVGGSFSPDGINEFGPLRVFYEIKSYGIATIAEAAEIGGDTSSTNNQLVQKNEVSEYGCSVKNADQYTDNQCVKYVDIERTIKTYTIYAKIENIVGADQISYDCYQNIYQISISYSTEMSQNEYVTSELYVRLTYNSLLGEFVYERDAAGIHVPYQDVSNLHVDLTLSPPQQGEHNFHSECSWSVTNGSTTEQDTSWTIALYVGRPPQEKDVFYSESPNQEFVSERTFTNATNKGNIINLKIIYEEHR